MVSSAHLHTRAIKSCNFSSFRIYFRFEESTIYLHRTMILGRLCSQFTWNDDPW